jgi:hypothetical protein
MVWFILVKYDEGRCYSMCKMWNALQWLTLLNELKMKGLLWFFQVKSIYHHVLLQKILNSTGQK